MAYKDTTWYVNFGDGSTTGYYAVPVWPGALTVVAAGTWCRQLTTPAVGSERCYVAIAGGTTGAAEPVWVTTRGADSGALVDGTVTWQECTGMPGPCGDLTNSNVWTDYKNTSVSIGACIYDSVSGSLQLCKTAGTAGNGSLPGFSATAGTTTADNTVTWVSLGASSTYSGAPWKYPHARLANALTANWASAGNNIFVGSSHTETQASVLSMNPSLIGTVASPVNIYCTPTNVAPPTSITTGATISTTGANDLYIGTNSAYTGKSMYIYGITFSAGNSSNTASIKSPSPNNAAINSLIIMENCTLILNNTSASSFIGLNGQDENQIILYNCNLVFGSSSQGISPNIGSGFTMIGGSAALTGTAPTTLAPVQSNKSQFVRFRDVDLSGITGNLVGVANLNFGKFLFEECRLGSAVTPITGSYSGSYGPYVKIHNSDSTTTNYRYYFSNYMATAQQETTIVRTGSLATDGTTPISWNIATTANSKFLQPFVSEEISIWNDTTGSTVTITLYLISNTTLNNNDFWAEAEYPSSSSYPLGATVNSKMAILGTPAALTSDSSTWGGSTNKYKIVLSCTPQMKGPIKVRFYAAKASATIYQDPYIYLS